MTGSSHEASGKKEEHNVQDDRPFSEQIAAEVGSWPGVVVDDGELVTWRGCALPVAIDLR